MIAVTGGNGLVGTEILKRLAAEGTSAFGIKRETSDLRFANSSLQAMEWKTADVLDSSSLIECFKNVNTVIHTAAIVSFDPRQKKELFQVNVEGTKNVVNACLAAGVQQLIHVSSVAALGRKKDVTAIDETAKWETSALNTFYAESKYLAELEVYRGMEEGLSVSIVNPSFVLGIGDWEKSSSKIFQYIWDENKFFSTGLCNYVDVRDVAKIILKLLDRSVANQRWIASAAAVSYKDLFEKIAARLNKNAPSIEVNPTLTKIIAAIEELKSKLLGRKPMVTRESVKSASGKCTFINQKSIQQLGMSYFSLEETLDLCCAYYLRTYSTNK